ETTSIRNATRFFKNEAENGDLLFEEEIPDIPEDALIYEINGPLFFGASQKFQEVIKELKQSPRVLILRIRHVPFIDATGMKRLKEMYKNLEASGTSTIISGANEDIKKELLNMNVYQDLGNHNICDNIDQAIAQAKEIINSEY